MIATIGVCAVLALAIYAVAYFVLDEHRAAPPSRARAALAWVIVLALAVAASDIVSGGVWLRLLS